MTDDAATIGFFTLAGQPVGFVARDDPFVVIATRKGNDKPPAEIVATVGDESITLRLDPTAPVPTYTSDPTTMARLGVDADHGETATASIKGASAGVAVHHDHFEASFAQINAFFNQQMKFWTTFLLRLMAEGGDDDPEVRLWMNAARTKISLINRGRAHLNDESQLARFRLDAGTYYASRVRGPVSSPSLLRFWAEYGRDQTTQDGARITRYRRDAKDAAWDSVLGLVGALLLGLYEEITDATFAGPIYQLITGQNIRGREASRGFAVLQIAFGAALESIGIKLSRWMSEGPRRAWGRPDPDASLPPGRSAPRPKPGTGLVDSDLPGGTAVHPRDAGMTEAALAQLQHVGRKHGVTFVLRPANKSSLKWQQEGYPFKPMAIKQKTIQEIDYHIGAPRRHDGKDAEGLVGFFEPTLPATRPAGMSDEMWGAVQSRFQMRKAEWEKLQGDMKKLEDLGLIELREGLIIDTGLSEFVRRSKPGSMPDADAIRFAGKGTGKPITGDYDLFSIVRNGRELSDAEAADILEEIKDVFVKIQHGSNRAWRAGDKYARDKAAIEFDHTGKDTEMYEALAWHLEGKHTERLQGLSPAKLRQEAVEAGIDAAGKADDELVDLILDARGWRARSKGEALIVVVPEPGAAPVAYWHGNPVPEGTFKEILGRAGVDIKDVIPSGSATNGAWAARAILFRDEQPPRGGSPESAQNLAPSPRAEAFALLQTAWLDRYGLGYDGDSEAEVPASPTFEDADAYLESGVMPAHLVDPEAPAVSEQETAEIERAQDGVGGDDEDESVDEVLDDVEAIVTGDDDEDIEAVAGAGADLAGVGTGAATSLLGGWLLWALGGLGGLAILLVILMSGGDGGEPAAVPEATAIPTVVGGGDGADGGGGIDDGDAAGGGSDPEPDIPVDMLMVVEVDGKYLPIHQFMVLGPHAPGVLIVFSGGDSLDVFPDYILLTDESYAGDPETACSTDHFHMPEFMPTAMDINGVTVPEPDAAGCGYGRTTDAFPIRVPTAKANSWQEDTGWDPRDGEPLVRLTALAVPFTTDAGVLDLRIKVIVENTGQVPWSAVTITDSVGGALFPGGGPGVKANTCAGVNWALEPFEKRKCEFTIEVRRQSGSDSYTSTVTINVVDDDGDAATGAGSPLMLFTASAPPIEVTKTPSEAVIDRPGPVEFTIEVSNNGSQPLEIISMIDDVFGSLFELRNPRVSENTCPEIEAVVAAQQTISCTFVGVVASTEPDGNHLDEVIVFLLAESGDLAAASDDALIVITEPGPPDINGPVVLD